MSHWQANAAGDESRQNDLASGSRSQSGANDTPVSGPQMQTNIGPPQINVAGGGGSGGSGD